MYTEEELMFDIGIFAPFGADHDRNIAYCRDAGASHIVLNTGNISSDDAPAAEALKTLADQYASAEVVLAGLTPPRLSLDACVDDAARTREMGYMRRLIENMGHAQIPLVHFYLSADAAPTDPDERQQHWQGLVGIFRELGQIGDGAGVRISTHTFHVPDRLIWNKETFGNLMDATDSSAHGLTFCQGKSQMAGDSLPEVIRHFGDKVFMVHVRDIATKAEGPTTPEIEQRLADLGYLEVPFGAGEVDMVGTIRALKEIDYKGQIYPEHFPSIAGDHAAGLAWTLGYIRALDQAVVV